MLGAQAELLLHGTLEHAVHFFTVLLRGGRFVALYGPQAPAPEQEPEPQPTQQLEGILEGVELSTTVRVEGDA